jgi:PAS domain S-box-containing protein
LEAQGDILEGMAGGARLSDTAHRIARLIEKLLPESRCAILLVRQDGNRLKVLAGPNLPASYSAALENVTVPETAGSIAAAVMRREPVIVADTACDPLWETLQEFAAACAIRASWALPILHEDGSVLGVVAIYYRDPRAPDAWDGSALNSCIKLIRLALAAERREQALKATDARWRAGAEAMGLGTFDLDFETGIDKWSPAMRSMLGVSDDIPSTFETFLSLVHPEDRAGFLARMPAPPSLHDGGKWREELRILKADTGEERTILSKGVVVSDPDGTVQHAIGTLYDITERRQRERELERAKAAAESANRAKSRFLASMSHELRTPLNAIIGFSDMIRSRVFGPMLPERYASYIEDIHKSGTHLLSLINDVLDMAKIEAQKFELKRARFPLLQLADHALMLVRPQATAREVELALDIPPGLTLNADERAMRQVLVNLLSNAVKFTGPGGTVRLFGERLPRGGLALGVEDNGMGMDSEGLTTALEPFGQIQMDVTAERSGTGLGLPLAKAMIESHGASFHINSQVGIGTRVWAEFPVTDIAEIPRTACLS